MRCTLAICAFLILCGNASAAQAQDLRVERPVLGSPLTFSPSADREDLDIYRGFLRWRARYIRPLFCGMVFCGGSCAAYNDACLMPVKGEILKGASRAFSCEGDNEHEHEHEPRGGCRIAPINENRQ